MNPEDLVRLRHMLDSTMAILSFIQGRKRQDLDKDRLLLSGVLREFEILGEAAGRVSKKTQAMLPELPWKQLVGMRNRLIHAYFDVDHDIVWKTIKESLPAFCRQLEQVLSQFQ